MVSGMSFCPLLLAATLLAWPLSSCVVVKIDSPAGVRIKPELKRGMSYAAARTAMARGGVITAEGDLRELVPAGGR